MTKLRRIIFGQYEIEVDGVRDAVRKLTHFLATGNFVIKKMWFNQ